MICLPELNQDFCLHPISFIMLQLRSLTIWHCTKYFRPKKCFHSMHIITNRAFNYIYVFILLVNLSLSFLYERLEIISSLTISFWIKLSFDWKRLFTKCNINEMPCRGDFLYKNFVFDLHNSEMSDSQQLKWNRLVIQFSFELAIAIRKN